MTASTDLRDSPLATWRARFSAVSSVPKCFAIRELAFTAQINLRGDPLNVAFTNAVREVLGTELPLTPNTWADGRNAAILWLGPDEWLVTADEGPCEALCEAFAHKLAGTHHSVTDVSSSRTIIEISGKHVRTVLGKGCSLDLHADAFAPPRCAQSLLAKVQVILQCMEARPLFRLYVRISFAEYLARWFVDAAAETRASLDLDTERIAARLG